MLLTHIELMNRARFWLVDERRDLFTEDAIKILVNEAYQSLVHEIDRMAAVWEATPQLAVASETTSGKHLHGQTTVTPVVGTREYALNEATGVSIRRVLDVVELGSDEDDRTPVDLVPYALRDHGRDGVYVFQAIDYEADTTRAIWYLGQCNPDSYTNKLQVRWLRTPELLGPSNAVPWHVPPDFHELIAYKAAILGKIAMKMDAGELTGIYAEGLAHMRTTMTRPAGIATPRIGTSRRIG